MVRVRCDQVFNPHQLRGVGRNHVLQIVPGGGQPTVVILVV